jgi:hypothetical protein
MSASPKASESQSGPASSRVRLALGVRTGNECCRARGGCGVLMRLLETRTAGANPLDGLALAIFSSIQACSPHLGRFRFIYEKTRGQRPKDFQQRVIFGFALQWVAAEDAAVHRTMAEVINLVKPPSALCAIRKSSAGLRPWWQPPLKPTWVVSNRHYS